MLFKRFRFRRLLLLRLVQRSVLGCIVFLAFALVFTSDTAADPFYPSGDTKFCQFAQAAAISYSSLPNNSLTARFTYDQSKIKGQTLDWIRSTNIEAVADVTFPDARRINNIADHVSVPPNTNVDLDAYYYNYAGHPVTLYESLFYTSMPSHAAGDLTRLGAPGTERHEGFIYDGSGILRTGKAYTSNTTVVVPAHAYSNLPKGDRLVSFTTIQPLKITKRSIIPEFKNGGKLYLKYEIEVENISTYTLPNISVRDIFPDGEVRQEVFSIQPNSKKILQYEKCLCYDYNYNILIPQLRLQDPNSHLEKAGEGSSSLFSYSPETRIFLTRRNDSGSTINWSGYQGDFTTVGTGAFLSIELLPYEIYSLDQSISVKPDVKPMPLLSDDDEHLVSQNNIKQDDVTDLTLELKNEGAYLKDIQIEVKYDNQILEFVGNPQGLELADGLIRITIPRIENSEILTEEFKFKPLDSLPDGDHSANYQITATSGDLLSFSRTLNTIVQVKTEPIDTGNSQTIELPPKVKTTNNFYGDTQMLANTGQPIYYFAIIYIVIISLWKILSHQQKIIYMQLELLSHTTSQILLAYYKKRDMRLI